MTPDPPHSSVVAFESEPPDGSVIDPLEPFALTPDEQRRVAAAPFVTNPGDWAKFAAQLQSHLLADYAEGEIGPLDALRTMRSCSLGCALNDRIMLMANLGDQFARITPPTGVRKPPFPLWLRRSAASLVQMLLEDRPGEPFTPNDANGYTTPITRQAMEWLAALGLCNAPQQPTENDPPAGDGQHTRRRSPAINERLLYSWYHEARKAGTVPTPTKTGPKHNKHSKATLNA